MNQQATYRLLELVGVAFCSKLTVKASPLSVLAAKGVDWGCKGPDAGLFGVVFRGGVKWPVDVFKETSRLGECCGDCCVGE
jgi:hypothetical protein